MPDELPVTGVLEPTAEGVMPTQVSVEGLIHGRNIALARYVTAGDDLPGKAQPGDRPFVIVTKMLALHVADRHRTHRRLSGLFLGPRRRMPGGDYARGRRPIDE